MEWGKLYANVVDDRYLQAAEAAVPGAGYMFFESLAYVIRSDSADGTFPVTQVEKFGFGPEDLRRARAGVLVEQGVWEVSGPGEYRICPRLRGGDRREDPAERKRRADRERIAAKRAAARAAAEQDRAEGDAAAVAEGSATAATLPRPRRDTDATARTAAAGSSRPAGPVDNPDSQFTVPRHGSNPGSPPGTRARQGRDSRLPRGEERRLETDRKIDQVSRHQQHADAGTREDQLPAAAGPVTFPEPEPGSPGFRTQVAAAFAGKTAVDLDDGAVDALVADVLGRSRTPVTRPLAFVLAAIGNESDPAARWMPRQRVSREPGAGRRRPHCGDRLCNPGTRRRETPDGDDAGACPKCSGLVPAWEGEAAC